MSEGGGAGAILVVNAGSTSLKLSLVEDADRAAPVPSLEAARDAAPVAVAHRVVHGGADLRAPETIDAGVLEAIERASALAPLHNRPALAAIRDARDLLPDVPHVAVFDTAFHATLPDEAAVYALPERWRDWGVRRYGFHGLSVAWAAERVPELVEVAGETLRLVVLHLGGGCSATAVAGGRSVDTTMGFSPLEGLTMATRSGSVDPGALLYLLRERGVEVEELDRALNHESGLLGLSGIASGVRDLEDAEERGDERARLALEVYAHRAAAAIGALTASLGGLDALAFTAGVGERSPRMRSRICARLGFLGIELDHAANETADPDAVVSTMGSRAAVAVVRAREDVVAARAARLVLSGAATP